MAQAQTVEKLHAACDECRARKLKCSGDVPCCVRCSRENIHCVYSPQKQMGRPRKRRRDGEADKPTEQPVESQKDYSNIFNDLPAMADFTGFSLTSPPSLQDTQSSSGSGGHGAVTPIQLDLDRVHPFEIQLNQDLGYPLNPPIDPSFWDLQPTNQPNNLDNVSSDQTNIRPCNCLGTTYLTLGELQSVTTFSFPQVIIPLRKAMSAISDLIHCKQCPKESFSAIQNVQSIVSLFKAVVDRFNKVLIGVNAEATELERIGQKKPYRIGDNNPALFHLHTGTLDCPMGFNIELEAKDWRRIVKTALKTEVYGGGSNPRPLLGLVRESEDRQQKWHENGLSWSEEMKQLHGRGHECDKTQSCETLGARHIRRAVDNLEWD